MPLYTYKCPSCCQTREILQTIKEPSPVCKRCVEASCGAHIPEMERMWKKTGKHNLRVVDFMKLIIKIQNQK